MYVNLHQGKFHFVENICFPVFYFLEPNSNRILGCFYKISMNTIYHLVNRNHNGSKVMLHFGLHLEWTVDEIAMKISKGNL